MSKVTQLEIGEISPIVQDLLELPWKFGTGYRQDWAGRKQLNTHQMHHATHKDMSFISHDGSQNRSYNTYFTDEKLKLRERKNQKDYSVLTCNTVRVKETNLPGGPVISELDPQP